MTNRRRQLASDRSPRWAFFEKFEVPDYDNYEDPDRNYLTRWRLIQTPWFGIYVHRMDTPDPRPTLHDHPWSFLSVILRGGYLERRLDPHTMTVDEQHLVHWFNRMRTHDAHAIRVLARVPTWTLVFVGRRTRTWGYWDQDPDGWWRWDEFDKHENAEAFVAALERRAQR